MKVVVPVPDIEKHYKGTYSGDQADQHQELQNCLLWRTSTDPFKTESWGSLEKLDTSIQKSYFPW